MRPSRSLLLALAALLAGCGGGGGSKPSAPRIATPPASQTVALGAAATFRVVATGGDLTYQWTKDGVDVPGATGATFTISPVAVADSAAYRVRVESGGRTTTSDPAYLFIQGAPQIVSEPADVVARAGESVTFNVGATGDEPLTYQWSRNGAPLDGATSPSYTVASAGSDTVGLYSVVVTNPKGRATSATASLTIGVPRPPTISGQPVSKTVALGASATFSVTASGTGLLSYQWTKDGTNVPGATGPSLTVVSASASDAGGYRVVVTNAEGGATSDVATLTVVAGPVITSDPVSQTKNPGESVTFSVTATGGGLSYQWTKGGADISGATGAAYTISSVTNSDAGSFAVRVSNLAGTATSAAATLTVRIPPSILQQPRIVVNAGSTSVTVVATGTDIGYQWLRNGAVVSGANAATYTLGAVNASNRGIYTVIVSNAAGSVTSQGVNVQ